MTNPNSQRIERVEATIAGLGTGAEHASAADTDLAPLLAALAKLREARNAPYSGGERAVRERYEDGIHSAVDALVALNPEATIEGLAREVEQAEQVLDSSKRNWVLRSQSLHDTIRRERERASLCVTNHETYRAEAGREILSLRERAEKAEAEAATLRGEMASARGERDAHRELVARLHDYCAKHKLGGFGDFVDRVVTDECDRLRAALDVERKSVDAMRACLFIEADREREYAGVTHRTTLAAACRAVDERRKGDA